jgi:hypothetical protein
VTLGPCIFGLLDRWIFGPLDYRTIEMLISGPLGPQAVRILRSFRWSKTSKVWPQRQYSDGPMVQASKSSRVQVSDTEWSKCPTVQMSWSWKPQGPEVTENIFFYIYIYVHIYAYVLPKQCLHWRVPGGLPLVSMKGWRGLASGMFA